MAIGTGNIRYEFSELDMGQACMVNCSSEFNALRDEWIRLVREIGLGAWLDRAGNIFQEISALWDSGSQLCIDFQNDLARGVAQARANGEQALQECMRLL